MNTASLAFPRPRPVKASSADDWFFALDQRQIGVGPHGWVAQVLGIHREHGGLWVQMAPLDNPSATLVLRVSTSTHLDDVLAALERRRPTEESKPEIIDFRT